MFISKRCGCTTSRSTSPINAEGLAKLSSGLTVISVKSRLELLFLLHIKPHCVCDLVEHTKMSQSLISHHLASLNKEGLIVSKRNGKYSDYLLTAKGEKAVKALELFIK